LKPNGKTNDSQINGIGQGNLNTQKFDISLLNDLYSNTNKNNCTNGNGNVFPNNSTKYSTDNFSSGQISLNTSLNHNGYQTSIPANFDQLFHPNVLGSNVSNFNYQQNQLPTYNNNKTNGQKLQQNDQFASLFEMMKKKV